MNEISNFVQIRPDQLLIVLFGLVLLTIIVTFVLPPILGSQKLTVGFSYRFKLIKKHAVLSATLAGIILVTLSGSYLWYLSTRPQVISSDRFRTVESEPLKFIEDSSLYNVVTEGELLLIDVRPEKEFLKAHIHNSISVPADDFESNRSVKFTEGRRVAVYSIEADFENAEKVGYYIFNNFEPDKVYIINDGYESLSTGFTLYTGDTFEPLPINNEDK